MGMSRRRSLFDARPLHAADSKFHGAIRRDKVGAILSLTAVSCISTGLGWMACYLYYGSYLLSLAFVALAAAGVVAASRRRRCDSRSLLVVSHVIFAVILLIAIIDAPFGGVSRTVHLYFLPLAAGAAFTFEARERYGSTIFPLLCAAMCAAFSTGLLDSIAPGMSPPAPVRQLGAVTNPFLAMVVLATVFALYRADSGRRLSLERELARAVPEGRIDVLYQPQATADGQIVGAEALARWRRSAGDVVAPDVFIPLAEESGLIKSIGLDVLRQACATLEAWSHVSATRALKVSVNISPLQLADAGFVEAVTAVIVASGASPALLEFELTESALCGHVPTTLQRMRQIEALGVSWALDDFGTGFSSLSALRTLPVRRLKIDRQFLVDAGTEQAGHGLLGKIIEISQVMGMQALAEGVETRAQLQLLVSLGCSRFQGFLFGRPMPATQLQALMEQAAGRALPGP